MLQIYRPSCSPTKYIQVQMRSQRISACGNILIWPGLNMGSWTEIAPFLMLCSWTVLPLKSGYKSFRGEGESVFWTACHRSMIHKRSVTRITSDLIKFKSKQTNCRTNSRITPKFLNFFFLKNYKQVGNLEQFWAQSLWGAADCFDQIILLHEALMILLLKWNVAQTQIHLILFPPPRIF